MARYQGVLLRSQQLCVIYLFWVGVVGSSLIPSLSSAQTFSSSTSLLNPEQQLLWKEQDDRLYRERLVQATNLSEAKALLQELVGHQETFGGQMLLI